MNRVLFMMVVCCVGCASAASNVSGRASKMPASGLMPSQVVSAVPAASAVAPVYRVYLKNLPPLKQVF